MLRGVIAPFVRSVVVLAVAVITTAQVNPPATPTPAPAPAASPSAPPVPVPETAPPTATPPPTPAPLIVDPPSIAVEPGKMRSARVNAAYGQIIVTVADPAVASVVADQMQRTIFVTGIAVGTTTITVSDLRGTTRTVPVRVAYAAGSAADSVSLRVTGNPTSLDYLRDAIARAVNGAATLRTGATVAVSPEDVPVRAPLRLDERLEVDVPVTIGGDGFLTVSGTTHAYVENVALPSIRPSQLLVSDYPERITANGVLFDARLTREAAQRFLYYHYDPGTEPPRRVLLKAKNASNAPATVQLIDGIAGPGPNEMEVGHLSTKRFLVREARNEGSVVTIPAGATVNLIDHPMPPQNVVSGILQLRLVDGDPIDLTLVAQNASAPLDLGPESNALLSGGALHARGVYPVPTFVYQNTYDVQGADLEIPIGQLPLPNLREGQALGGDYGVEARIVVVLVNTSRSARPVALYANPRGGRATGTFLIDNTLVQAHALAPFSKFKLWQETIPPHQRRLLEVVTMPEGGSSYPLRLIFAPDDGSVAPGAPGSPIY